MSPILAIIVPVYNEQELLASSVRKLATFMSSLTHEQVISKDCNLYLIDDGGRDRSWSIIESLCREHPNVKGIKLSRNCGHQNAILAGVFSADFDCVITIDADLQDDIHCIREMVEKYQRGAEIVFGIRDNRDSDTFFKRATAQLFYKLMHIMGVPVVYNHADYRLMSRRVVGHLRDYREVNLFLRGIITLVGFRTDTVYYKRLERTAGETKYPLRKMIDFAIQGITSFSSFPLRLISILGFATFGLTIALSAWVLLTKFVTNEAVPGWASTVLPLYFLGGVQLLCLGVIGEYIGKIYLETKARPRYLIERMIDGSSFEPRPEPRGTENSHLTPPPTSLAQNAPSS